MRIHPGGSATKLLIDPVRSGKRGTFYELVVERHRKTTTVITSNRQPSEWLTMMADPLLAQSAIDRLVSTAHELIIEGDLETTMLTD